jgi:Immunoglobulin I-set domain
MQGDHLEYQWHKNGQPLTEADNITAREPLLIINAPHVDDSGRYHVTVSNAADTRTSIQAVVHVAPPLDAGGAGARPQAPRKQLSDLTSHARRRQEADARRRATSSATGEAPGQQRGMGSSGVSGRLHTETIAEADEAEADGGA